MIVLLDTNIIIYRENYRVSNKSVGYLYNWIEKLGYTKVVHPQSFDEILSSASKEYREILMVKLSSYEKLVTRKEPDEEYMALIKDFSNKGNDIVDNSLLYEVYTKTVDFLITEDRKMIKKAEKFGIENKVFTINSFIGLLSYLHPKLIDYSELSVAKTKFGLVDIKDLFFDSFKQDYREFEDWFRRKNQEDAYISLKDDSIVGFLYLKVEEDTHEDKEITPALEQKKRIKIGTFKVESTGYRLGERFLKIIFDNALLYNVDEIYVTLFDNRQELNALEELLINWGFYLHGFKKSTNGIEKVLIKSMNQYNKLMNPKYNFPLIDRSSQKFIMPIKPEYHTDLFPDSILSNEKSENFIEYLPHRYALQKVYISFAYNVPRINAGDIMLFYRIGVEGRKQYTSVITSVGVIQEVITTFSSKEEFLAHCENRSVFTINDLNSFWRPGRKLSVIKFLYVKALNKKVTLQELNSIGLYSPSSGPRPYSLITNEDFENILTLGNTSI